MKTKQNVQLIYATPLWLISNGIRYSHDNHKQSDTSIRYICPICGGEKEDYLFGEQICSNCNVAMEIKSEMEIGEKDFSLIKRIGFANMHESVLEHSLIVFNVKMATKALLEESRHRIGLSQTVTSSRFALDLIDIEFEPTRKEKINEFQEKQKKELIELIDYYRDEKGRIKKHDMDDLAMLLPQAFIYKMQLTFNLRSLVHFLRLRITSNAHYTIRNIAKQLIDELPVEYKELVLEDKIIKKNYLN